MEERIKALEERVAALEREAQERAEIDIKRFADSLCKTLTEANRQDHWCT